MMRKCMFYTDVCNFYQRTVSRKLIDFLMFSINKDFHGLLSNRIVQRSVAYEEKEIYEHQISNFLKFNFIKEKFLTFLKSLKLKYEKL